MSNVNINRLAMVLKHANSCPPPHAREDFYRLKEAICQKYGKRDGYDVQEIKQSCWGERYSPCDEHCGKCGGTGIYYRYYVTLERWKIGSQIFHKPLERKQVPPVLPNIFGKITHRRSKLAFACWRVLSLLFAPQFHLYLDQFRASEADLRRFKEVLAYLLEFDRARWRVKAVTWPEMQEAHKRAMERMIPF